MRNKIVSAEEALSHIKSGMTIMMGGFGYVGSAAYLIGKLADMDVSDLTIISNDMSTPNKGGVRLLTSGKIKKLYATYIGLDPSIAMGMLNGTYEVELVPQGTLAERIRAGGSGLGGVLTPTGIGTEVEVGKQKMVINGKEYLLEMPIRADVALIFGSIVDKSGNVVYKGTTQNFNPLMAFAADMVICEAEKIVEVGEIAPENVRTPGVLVDYIVQREVI